MAQGALSIEGEREFRFFCASKALPTSVAERAISANRAMTARHIFKPQVDIREIDGAQASAWRANGGFQEELPLGGRRSHAQGAGRQI